MGASSGAASEALEAHAVSRKERLSCAFQCDVADIPFDIHHDDSTMMMMMLALMANNKLISVLAVVVVVMRSLATIVIRELLSQPLR